MPATRSSAPRPDGARSHGPAADAGEARSAMNGNTQGLHGGLFALRPGEDRMEFAALHAAVTSDWGPRDAYERRWVRELVAGLWRQDRLRTLELATLTAAAAESPPAEATVKKLLAFARYGARIDKDIGRALQALRVLRNRPDAWIDELRNGTAEPDAPKPQQHIFTNDFLPRTCEPDVRAPDEACTNELFPGTCEPEPPAHNRHERRRLAALARGRRAA